ncbi:hypothetical protein [Sediminimonas qiaohouensis]|uniref:hypothetical protein n=1 Tax=Sediminimonas qiaohouensis TaxID=552061 RepID=UPI00041B5C1C|nr:hypothetical protein [Sediminimonas qiaohouensis]
MTRVLLLDTSFAARPVHDWLRDQGLDVWTIGNRPLDLLARRYPKRYIEDDYAEVETVRRHVDRLGVTYVVPGCTDVSIETAQRLTGLQTAFDPPETYRRLADKAAFRALCEELDLPAPRRVSEANLPHAGRLIAKPSDAFSGRGISVFDGSDHAAARAALNAARAESRTGDALLETYAEGQLYSYSCFLERKRVVDAVIVREDGSVTPYAVDTSHVAAEFPAAGTTQLRDSIERLAAVLNLVDGLLHVQFIWDGSRPWLIELSRRCPGDLYPWLVQLSTGLPHAARYASYFVNRPAPDAPLSRRHILRHTVTAGHENYDGVFFAAPVPIVEYHALAVTGREMPPQGRIDRVALMFLEYPSAKALAEQHDLFQKRGIYMLGAPENSTSR